MRFLFFGLDTFQVLLSPTIVTGFRLARRALQEHLREIGGAAGFEPRVEVLRLDVTPNSLSKSVDLLVPPDVSRC